MDTIKNYINQINANNQKALAIFLTAGFPYPESFCDLACSFLDEGADILEIGIPFSDPLADGPIIQQSSHIALQNGINMKNIFEYAELIKARTPKKLVAMGYANPILAYGVSRFMQDAANAGFDGLIVPDIPYDEYDGFYGESAGKLDTILLTTPVTKPERIRLIDQKSKGFLYYVSVTGTTGVHSWAGDVLENLRRAKANTVINKFMVGFGVSSPEDIMAIRNDCDGVIVGSAIIRQLLDRNKSPEDVARFIGKLKKACL